MLMGGTNISSDVHLLPLCSYKCKLCCF